MLTTDRERRICAKYSTYDDTGHVHCWECPLHKGNFELWDFRCKANTHYDAKEKEWVYDQESEMPWDS